MGNRYAAVHKLNGHVLSSPTELHDPRSGRLACSIWSWVPDPDNRKAHHFPSRAKAKAIIRTIGTDLSKVTFRKVA